MSIAHLASGTNTESCTLSFTGSSILSKRAASISASSFFRIAVCSSDRKRADLVGRQPHLKDVQFLFRRTEGLQVGTAQRHELRIEPSHTIGSV